MDATIERSGLTTLLITAGATHDIEVTPYKLNSSQIWEAYGSIINILAAATDTFTYSEDGVYKFAVEENSITTEISDIQYDDYMTCLKAKTKDIIDCGCQDECDDCVLYLYTSAFFLGVTFFGDYVYSIKDITTLSADELEDLQNINNAIIRTNKYIVNCT